MQTAVVIGASSGVGLALCKLLQTRGSTVLATVRRTSAELSELGTEVVEGVDVAEETSMQPVLQALGSRHIDLLVVAAGCQTLDTIDTVTRNAVRQQFEVNAVGPLFAVKALREQLSDGAKVVLISSKNGSVTEVDFTGGELYGYRMGKAALNIAGATLARDLKPRSIPVALIHPGVVNTQMLRGLRSARGVPDDKLTANTLTPDESAERIMGVVEDLNLENTGSFWAADTDQTLRDTRRVMEAVQGHWLSACLGVLMKLKIPEILASAGENTMSFAEVADKAGVTEAGMDHFYKVMRAMGQWEMLEEPSPKEFRANGSTKLLVRGKDASLGHFVDHQINEPKWEAWKVLPEAVRTGQVAFALAHDGMDMHQYDEVTGNEAFADDFQKAMTYFTKLSLTGGEVPLKSAYDWQSARCIMDVGGGRGEMLSSCMAAAGPAVRGVLMDRPWVLDSVDIPGTFEAKGIEDAKSRLKFVAAEVREPFPAEVKDAGVDVLVMKHFLSGFSDADAEVILKHCREVLTDDGKILLLQTIVPEAGDSKHNTNRDGVAPGIFAVEILAQCPGGGWRTLDEWKVMFKKAGFSLEKCEAVGASMHLMVWDQI